MFHSYRVDKNLLTFYSKSKLSANYHSFLDSKEVITDCAPTVVIADLNSSKGSITTLQSGVTLHTYCKISGNKSRKEKVFWGGCALYNYSHTNSRLASHSSIFKVCTVVATQRIGRTVDESVLRSTALDIVQPDLTSTIGESGKEGHSTCRKGTCLLDSKLIALELCMIPVVENSSCRQTTVASGVPQKSSHTVPQTLLLQISTRPSRLEGPPLNLKSPLVQPK